MKQLYRIIAVMLCIVLFTACNGKAVDSEQASNQQGSPASQNSSESSSIQEELSPLVLAKQGNPDTVAWLRIPGTDIDNPVMQTANNEDYLRKDENGKYDIWGSYFADYYSVLIDHSSLKQNTVIYRHSESSESPNGKRFTQLFKYLNIDFLKENPNIYLAVGEGELVFEVVGVFFTDTDFYYIDPNPSDQGFDAFKKTIAGVDTITTTKQPCGAFVPACEPSHQGSGVSTDEVRCKSVFCSDTLGNLPEPMHLKKQQKRSPCQTPQKAVKPLPLGISILFRACWRWWLFFDQPARRPPPWWRCYFDTGEQRLALA